MDRKKKLLSKSNKIVKFIQTNNLQDCQSFPRKMKVVTYPKKTKVYTRTGHYVRDTESISMDLDETINTEGEVDENELSNEKDSSGNNQEISNTECEEEKDTNDKEDVSNVEVEEEEEIRIQKHTTIEKGDLLNIQSEEEVRNEEEIGQDKSDNIVEENITEFDTTDDIVENTTPDTNKVVEKEGHKNNQSISKSGSKRKPSPDKDIAIALTVPDQKRSNNQAIDDANTSSVSSKLSNDKISSGRIPRKTDKGNKITNKKIMQEKVDKPVAKSPLVKGRNKPQYRVLTLHKNKKINKRRQQQQNRALRTLVFQNFFYGIMIQSEHILHYKQKVLKNGTNW
jgi:hypothetical protein